MHEIKERLMQEIYDIEDKMKKSSGGKVSASDLDLIHKLTDTVKNICKIEMFEDDDYSEATDWMGEGRMYGTSYARGRRGNVKRDSMGRYSRDGYRMEGGSSYDRDGTGRSARRSVTHGEYDRVGGYSRDDAKHDMIEDLRKMINEAESEKERDALRRCMRALEEA